MHFYYILIYDYIKLMQHGSHFLSTGENEIKVLTLKPGRGNNTLNGRLCPVDMDDDNGESQFCIIQLNNGGITTPDDNLNESSLKKSVFTKVLFIFDIFLLSLSNQFMVVIASLISCPFFSLYCMQLFTVHRCCSLQQNDVPIPGCI